MERGGGRFSTIIIITGTEALSRSGIIVPRIHHIGGIPMDETTSQETLQIRWRESVVVDGIIINRGAAAAIRVMR